MEGVENVSKLVLETVSGMMHVVPLQHDTRCYVCSMHNDDRAAHAHKTARSSLFLCPVPGLLTYSFCQPLMVCPPHAVALGE